MPKKKSKYTKTVLESYKCDSCEFEACYESVRCPMCSSSITKII